MPGRSGSPPAVTPGEQPWTSVPDAWPARRVDDEPGRLVDDEQVLVLVGDPQVERLVRARARRSRARLELDLLPALEPVALRARDAVDEHRAGGEQALGRGARADLGQRGEEAVEPLAGRRLRNA